MKIKIETYAKIMLVAGFCSMKSYGQQLSNLTSSTPSTRKDAVRVNGFMVGPDTLNRLSQLHSGTYNDAFGVWSALGRPSVMTTPVPPRDQKMYGLTVNDSGDRAFFGTRNINSDKSNAIVGWGDNGDSLFTSTTTGPDRLVFEFHRSVTSSTVPVIERPVVLMPQNGSGVFMGIGTYGPTEQLHTTAGVRFQGLTAGTYTDMVVIDANGKLWRSPVPTGGGSGSNLGNLCSAASNPLTGNYEIPLSSFDFNFSGDLANRTKVNVGYACNAAGPGKLNALTKVQTDPSGNNSFGVHALTQFAQAGSNNTGVYGAADNFSIPGALAPFQKGVWGYANSEGQSIGVYGVADHAGVGGVANGAYGGYFESITGNAGDNYGVYAIAGKANTNNYAGKFSAMGQNAGTTCYGLYSEVTSFNSGSTNYGIYTTVGGVAGAGFGTGTGPNYAAFFDGDVVTTAGAFFSSDRTIKRDITSINNSIAIINKLNPVTYYFDVEGNPGIALPAERQYGFISQEIKEILPELTKPIINPAKVDKDGKEITPAKEILGLNYNGFIALLAKGMQEQQQQIEELKAMVQSLAGNQKTANGITGIPVTLGNDVLVLNQNVPNPFAESTVITYNIPSDFATAKIIFSTDDGIVIKTVNITQKGEGRLNIFADDLTHGIYTYSLVIDGKTVDTKKMVKQ